MTEGSGASPVTVSKPAPVSVDGESGIVDVLSPGAVRGASPAHSAVSLGTVVAAATATASPLSFTLRMPADTSTVLSGKDGQEQALLQAFERALPGERTEQPSALH